MPSPSVLSLLRERAGLQPNDTAFTYTDYEQDAHGLAESLTWSQAYRRSCNVAREVGRHGLALVHFESEKLSEGSAQRCAPQTGTPLRSYRFTRLDA